MKLREYINNLEVDTVKFLQVKRNLSSLRVYMSGESLYFKESSNQVEKTVDIKTFEEEIPNGDFSTLKSFLESSNEEYVTSSKHHETTSILQFLKEGVVMGQINCNFLRSQFLTLENKPLNYTIDDINNIYRWAKGHSYQIMPYRVPNAQQNIWHHFIYPKSYYYNPALNLFEAAIDINLNSINSKRWRLHIPKIDDRPTVEQLKTIEKFVSKSWDVRKLILDKLYHFYQSTARHDFELPKLDNQEQLFYFVSGGIISLNEGPDEIITLEFGTWDEEHGAYYAYYVNEHRLTEM